MENESATKRSPGRPKKKIATKSGEAAAMEIVTKKKRPRFMQQMMEEIEKNPPSAPPPEVIEEYIKNAGRPPMYSSAKDMQEIVIKYFSDNMMEVTDENGIHMGYRFCNRISLGDLAIYLGMSRSTLCEYAKSDEFSETIKNAKNIIENYYEKALQENRNPAGICFILKNGFGWKDVQDVRITPEDPLGPEPDAATLAQRYADALPCDYDTPAFGSATIAQDSTVAENT